MMKLFALFGLAAGYALGQPAMAPPRAGFVADNQNALRPVLGFAGNFLLGDAALAGVVSVASSGSFALVKTNSSLLALDGEGNTQFVMDTHPGPALFAFTGGGDPAFAYLSATRKLLAWQSGRFEAVAWNAHAVHGNVVAVGVSSTGAALVVQRLDGLWRLDISVPNGETVSETALPGITPPVLMLPDGSLLYGNGQALAIRRTDGSENYIDFTDKAGSFSQMSGQLARVDAGGRSFAVRFAQGTEQVWQLPEGNR